MSPNLVREALEVTAWLSSPKVVMVARMITEGKGEGEGEGEGGGEGEGEEGASSTTTTL